MFKETNQSTGGSVPPLNQKYFFNVFTAAITEPSAFIYFFLIMIFLLLLLFYTSLQIFFIKKENVTLEFVVVDLLLKVITFYRCVFGLFKHCAQSFRQ